MHFEDLVSNLDPFKLFNYLLIASEFLPSSTNDFVENSLSYFIFSFIVFSWSISSLWTTLRMLS